MYDQVVKVVTALTKTLSVVMLAFRGGGADTGGVECCR